MFVFIVGDVILIAAVLALVGLIPFEAVGALVVISLVGFFGWIGFRWKNRTVVTLEEYGVDSYETLEEKYVSGELSETEYKQLLEELQNTPDEYDAEE